MALGELSYVERFVTDNNSPLRVDSIILITLFMIVVPIALMNLLIGVAVGDIEAIKNQAEIRLLTNQVCDMTCFFFITLLLMLHCFDGCNGVSH